MDMDKDNGSGSAKLDSVNIGLIVGCVVGGLACLIAVILVVFCVAKRRQKQKDEAKSIDDGTAMAPPIAAVYGTAPRAAANREEPMVGIYSSADINTNYMGMRNVTPIANGQYIDMQMDGNNTGSSMPASDDYNTIVIQRS
jgi:hypothetical protein